MFYLFLKKRIVFELRSKELILSMIVFGIAIVFLFHFIGFIQGCGAKLRLGKVLDNVLFVATLGVHRSLLMKKNLMLFLC
ncbi:MAG: hypothetical protein CM1200mP1_05020 [Candidatus Neomarinimicrobiota bacterium]|nr:MAG: hypothetical protein CM1200mP1_05020 [Candidatus Neomarinimicrobiota bacterium]